MKYVRSDGTVPGTVHTVIFIGALKENRRVLQENIQVDV
jgi:hypothetical protein